MKNSQNRKVEKQKQIKKLSIIFLQTKNSTLHQESDNQGALDAIKYWLNKISELGNTLQTEESEARSNAELQYDDPNQIIGSKRPITSKLTQ